MKKFLGISLPKRESVFTFLRAQLSSQIASLSDFTVTVLLATVLHTYYVIATFLGAVTGGIVNATINYRWVFRAKDVKVTHVAIKYTVVWFGSIALNTGGTYLLTEAIKQIPNLPSNIFLVPKFVVSLLVGFVWNYNLHRQFVFRNRSITLRIPKKRTPIQPNKPKQQPHESKRSGSTSHL